MSQFSFADHKIPTELSFGDATRLYTREFVVFGLVVASSLVLLIAFLTYGLFGLILFAVLATLVWLYLRQRQEVLFTQQELDRVVKTHSRDMDLLVRMVEKNSEEVEEWQEKVRVLEARVSDVNLLEAYQRLEAQQILTSVLHSGERGKAESDYSKALDLYTITSSSFETMRGGSWTRRRTKPNRWTAILAQWLSEEKSQSEKVNPISSFDLLSKYETRVDRNARWRMWWSSGSSWQISEKESTETNLHEASTSSGQTGDERRR